ncbi:MAG: VOC family protein [Acidobacteria bacterium]|nr:VOC family protein [Acidobacteriota bacterium]
MSKTEVTTLKPHISLNVQNVEDSVNFYRKLFGIEPMKFIKGNTTVHSIVRDNLGLESEEPRFGYAKFDVQNPPLNFVLNEVSYSQGGTLSHLGIQVESTEDVLKIRERWLAEGLLTVDEMKVDCCYALQNKTWARDPDGNEWEVFVVLENTEARNTCTCGEKVEHQELSTSGCCTETDKTVSINRETQKSCC